MVRWGGVVRQELDFSCGLTSIATILRYHYDEQGVIERILLNDFIVMLNEEKISEVLAQGALP